jgi:hypothetical protein
MYGQSLDNVEHSSDALHHTWFIEQNTRLEYATFHSYECIYMYYLYVGKKNIIIGALSWVSKINCLMVAQDEKRQ